MRRREREARQRMMESPGSDGALSRCGRCGEPHHRVVSRWWIHHQAQRKGRQSFDQGIA